MTCKKHKSYRGKYPPRTDCSDCAMIYVTKQVQQVAVQIKALKSALGKA